MKSKKKSNTVKWGAPIEVVKSDFAKLLGNDPVFIKKREDAVRDLLKNPPPEWLLKKMRGD